MPDLAVEVSPNEAPLISPEAPASMAAASIANAGLVALNDGSLLQVGKLGRKIKRFYFLFSNEL